MWWLLSVAGRGVLTCTEPSALCLQSAASLTRRAASSLLCAWVGGLAQRRLEDVHQGRVPILLQLLEGGRELGGEGGGLAGETLRVRP